MTLIALCGLSPHAAWSSAEPLFLVVACNGQEPQAPNEPCTIDLANLALTKNPPTVWVPALQIVAASLLNRRRHVRQQHLDPDFYWIFVLVQVDRIVEVVLLNDRKPPLPVRPERKLKCFANRGLADIVPAD